MVELIEALSGSGGKLQNRLAFAYAAHRNGKIVFFISWSVFSPTLCQVKRNGTGSALELVFEVARKRDVAVTQVESNGELVGAKIFHWSSPFSLFVYAKKGSMDCFWGRTL